MGTNDTVCWGILAVLTMILASTIRNGHLTMMIGRNLAKEIAKELGDRYLRRPRDTQ